MEVNLLASLIVGWSVWVLLSAVHAWKREWSVRESVAYLNEWSGRVEHPAANCNPAPLGR